MVKDNSARNFNCFKGSQFVKGRNFVHVSRQDKLDSLVGYGFVANWVPGCFLRVAPQRWNNDPKDTLLLRFDFLVGGRISQDTNPTSQKSRLSWNYCFARRNKELEGKETEWYRQHLENKLEKYAEWKIRERRVGGCFKFKWGSSATAWCWQRDKEKRATSPAN